MRAVQIDVLATSLVPFLVLASERATTFLGWGLLLGLGVGDVLIDQLGECLSFSGPKVLCHLISSFNLGE